ncbi:APC family permease [Novosphingobium sp.]|uniref:APC family permease n=1 Tax=Novosphingobium sp. TaxID=1874826 RepID=UPI003BA95533
MDAKTIPAAQTASGHLIRSLGFLGLASVVFNGAVGAGIFALPGTVAHFSGGWAPLVIMAVGLAILPTVVVLAQLAGLFDETGGPVLYVSAAYGPQAGFQIGWMQCLAGTSSVAANVNLLADYALGLVPAAKSGAVMHAAVVFAAIGFILSINLLDAKRSSGWINRISVVKLLPLALLILLALPRVAGGHAPRPATEWSLAQAAILSVYSLGGFEGALCIAGEARDPRRDLPRALISVFLAVAALYALLTWGYVATAYQPGLEDKASLVTMASVLAGTAGTTIMGVTAVISIFGVTIVTTLVVSRRIVALESIRGLPAWFGAIRADTGLPRNAVLVTIGVISVLAMSGGFTALAALTVISRLTVYLGCALSLPAILIRRGLPVSPLVMGISAAAAAMCVALMTQCSRETWAGFALALAIGLAVKWMAGRSIVAAPLAAG